LELEASQHAFPVTLIEFPHRISTNFHRIHTNPRGFSSQSAIIPSYSSIIICID